MSQGLRNAIRAEMQCRAQRYKTIPADLLGEPVWDILLDLAMSRLDNKRIQITAVGLSAGLAPTTSLRWICRLEERGLIRRVPDEDDGRRTWLEILPETMSRLAACFGFDWKDGQESRPEPTEDAGSRSIFFPAEIENHHPLQQKFLPQGEKGKAGNQSLLLKRATDWVNQDYDERLSFGAQVLYVHGYLSPHEYRRIEMQIREDAERARDERVKARASSVW